MSKITNIISKIAKMTKINFWSLHSWRC